MTSPDLSKERNNTALDYLKRLIDLYCLNIEIIKISGGLFVLA
jgi:hypothetical protein